MPPVKPKKKKQPQQSNVPHRPRLQPPEEEYAGQLFRVREKDWEPSHPHCPTGVWGDNLPYEEAHLLKERVCGRRMSTTARVESMDVPPPDWWLEEHGAPAPVEEPKPTDPDLERMRAPALAAARGAATTANARRVINVPPSSQRHTLAPVPSPDIGGAPKVETPIDGDLPDTEFDQSDVNDLLDELGGEGSVS